MADESGSALVHGVASVTADRLAPKRVFWKSISRTRTRRPSGWYTAWDVVRSCLESFIYLSATLVCSSRLPMTMIQYASARATESKADPGSSGTNTSSSSDE